jgi:beta-glucosidase
MSPYPINFIQKFRGTPMNATYKSSLALFLIGTLGLLSGCVSTPGATGVTMGAHGAVTPVSKISETDRGQWWDDRNDVLNERAQSANHDLVMIGDSITHGWEGGGKDVWTKYYDHRNTMNIGIGGDRTEHVLWRLQNGNFEGQTPKLCVVMIGTNNFQANSAVEIADGIKAIVHEIRSQSPKTKVLLLAIFPRFEKPHLKRSMLAEASGMAAGVADGVNVHYLNINDVFLTEDGTLPKEVMPDFLHPNEHGYELWAEAMEPKIKELLGE